MLEAVSHKCMGLLNFTYLKELPSNMKDVLQAVRQYFIFTQESLELIQAKRCKHMCIQRIWDTFHTKVPIKKAYLRKVE